MCRAQATTVNEQMTVVGDEVHHTRFSAEKLWSPGGADSTLLLCDLASPRLLGRNDFHIARLQITFRITKGYQAEESGSGNIEAGSK